MALETTTSRVSYSGNGSTTAFSFPYYFLAQGDLVVIERVNSTGVETVKTLTTHYTVSGAGVEAGGTVTMLTAPATGRTLIIYRDPTITQGSDWRENDPMPAEQTEQSFDRAAMISQRLKDRLDRTVRLSDGFSPTFDPVLPTNLDTAGDKIPAVNSAGTGWAAVSAWPSVAGTTAAMAASASAAAASATAAASSASAASTSASAASTSASAASTSASAASTSATNAASSATAAASSATAAANSAAATIWRDVVFITFADSPFSLTNSHRGKLIAVSTAGGNVTINLPAISGLDLTSPFAAGIKKTTSDGNSITLDAAGTDTINGAGTKVMSVAQGGCTIIPDTDPAPDEWTSADFGAAAGNLTADRFSGNGSTTGFTLSTDPGTENNIFVFIDGVYQQKDTFSVSGTTLTFSTAPPTGTNNIEVMIGTLLSIGTPSDGTVTNAKFAAMNNNTIKGNVSGSSAVPSDLTGAQVASIFTAPTVQRLTAANGTYTTPANCKWIRIRMTGAGGGGGGGGTGAMTNGGTGGNTTFGAALLTATGGAPGRVSNDEGGVGGTFTVNSPAVTVASVIGGKGFGGSSNNSASSAVNGGAGGDNPFGGAGPRPPGGTTAGHPGQQGGGGAGGSANSTSGVNSGSGGGAGGYIEAIIASPSASYTYSVGSGGTAGAGGSNGAAGGAGGAGIIIVEEFYV